MLHLFVVTSVLALTGLTVNFLIGIHDSHLAERQEIRRIRRRYAAAAFHKAYGTFPDDLTAKNRYRPEDKIVLHSDPSRRNGTTINTFYNVGEQCA